MVNDQIPNARLPNRLQTKQVTNYPRISFSLRYDFVTIVIEDRSIAHLRPPAEKLSDLNHHTQNEPLFRSDRLS
jgi:hypothetical protein